MTEPYKSDPKRFSQSKKMVWTMNFAAIGLNILSIAVMKEHAAPVVAASVPSMLALSAIWTGATNWAEVRKS